MKTAKIIRRTLSAALRRPAARIALSLLLVAGLAGCEAFHSSRRKTAQGAPYEMVVVCPQNEWTGALGDTLRALINQPVPYLNQPEPQFDVLRVTERGFTNMVVDHRNILKILVDKAVPEASAAVQYDVTAEPQIVMTLQGPDEESLIDYIGAHGAEMLQAFEQAERDRTLRNNERYDEASVAKALHKNFGIGMHVTKGYLLAADTPDFVWARFEYPTASQGFFVYSYPYTGPDALTPEALVAARNAFAARIPGPSDGSYMTTADAFAPGYRMFRLEGRIWCELRGFWDVHGDFMGGPFVSYTTVDEKNRRVVTYDAYVYAPDLNRPRKRNYIRALEHQFYSIRFDSESDEK